jgi:MOSC domain-containing protein YiiM
MRDSGVVEWIHIAPSAGAAMAAIDEAVAIPGHGLAGDRYAVGAGTFSTWPKDHELTLFEAEAIDAMNLEHGLRLGPGDTRRNVTTRGIALNELVGREFSIGSVRCMGTRLCPPCDHLRKLIGVEDIVRIMNGRGGPRARILSGGSFRTGAGVESICARA